MIFTQDELKCDDLNQAANISLQSEFKCDDLSQAANDFHAG